MCQKYISETRCRYGRSCYFRHVELEEKPNKKSKKGGAKGSVAKLKNWHKRIAYLRILIRRSRFYGKDDNWEAVTRFKSHDAGIVQKCEPHERSPCAPKFADRSQQDTVKQERCARRVAWNLAKNVYNLKNTDKATLYSLTENQAMSAPISKSPEEQEFVLDSGASAHMLSRRDLSSDEKDTSKRSDIQQWS